jgi:hypothetical protein
MPAIEREDQYTRTLTIGRETEDKKSRPHFFAYIKELPENPPKGAIFRTKTSAGSGKIHHYRLYKGWSGHLVGLETNMKQYGSGQPEKVLIATMQDDDGDVNVELSFYNGYAGDLMKRLLDDGFRPDQSLSLSPFAMDKDNGSQNIGISCISGTDTKLMARTSDFGGQTPSPHLAGMPRLDVVPIKGKDTYDCTKMHDWLWAQLQEKVVPWLSSVGGAAQPKRQTIPDADPSKRPNAYPASVPESSGDDDLPF